MILSCFYEPHHLTILRKGYSYGIKLPWLLDFILIKGSLASSHVLRGNWNVYDGKDIVRKGSIFRHLGYPLGVNVMNTQLIEWMTSKLRDKFM